MVDPRLVRAADARSDPDHADGHHHARAASVRRGARLVELVRAREAQLVALSTPLPGHLLSVTRTCQLLRQLPRAPYVVVGEGAYRGDSARALAVGADAFADDPQALLQLPADRSERDAAH